MGRTLYTEPHLPWHVPPVQIGLATAFDSLWLLAMLVPFALRYGLVAREEAYLGHKFSDAYRGYCSRVRRWL